MRMLNNQLNLVPPANSLHQLADIESLSENLDKSLTNLAGKRVFFRSDFSKEVIPLQNLESSTKPLPYQMQSFATIPRERQVIGIDSSCALIGETEDGSNLCRQGCYRQLIQNEN